jgi:HAD superfamily hydrolase (TIGR01509 family)
MKLEALLFDVDGTLADTECDGHRIAFNKAFRKAGLNWHWSIDLYGRLLTVTGGKERIRHYIDSESPPFGPGELSDEFIARLHQSKTEFYTGLLARGGIPLRTGVERLLREARAKGIRMAIATTTTPANVEALLINTLGPDATSWFEVIAAGDIVPAKKPAPDIYLWAMKQMSLKAGQCMALEDSHNGVRSARDAGIESVLVTVNHYTRDHDFDSAKVVVNHLGEPEDHSKVLAGGPSPDRGFVDLAYLNTVHGESA